MHPADLLDYALGRLDGPRREQLERRIARDPALAERVARLVRNLERLLDDGRADRPPIAPTSPPGVRGDRPAPDSH
jgi:anti-sigma factor RsiW